MTNLTLLELAAVAVALDEEEGAEEKEEGGLYTQHGLIREKSKENLSLFTRNWLTTKWKFTGIFGWTEKVFLLYSRKWAHYL